MRGPVAFGFQLNPLGRPPADRLGREAAATILRPGEQRDRLTAGIFASGDAGDAVGRLDLALELTARSRPIVEKIERAAAARRVGEVAGVGGPSEARRTTSAQRLEDKIADAVSAGVIDLAEAALLRKAEAARRAAIEVDSFTLAEYLGTRPGLHRGAAKKEFIPRPRRWRRRPDPPCAVATLCPPPPT